MSRFKKLVNNKTHMPLQFLKYGLAGVVATATHIACFTALNETLLPADSAIAGTERGWNFLFSNAISFVLANVVAYLANRAWVFQPGRHRMQKEILLFFFLAAVAFLIGTPLGSVLVAHYPVNEYAVYAVVIALSVLTNFFGRKYWVFLH